MRTSGDAAAVDGQLIDAIGLALMAVDEHCRIVRFNAAAEQLTGHRAEDVVGVACAEVLQASLCNSHCPIRAALRDSSAVRTGTVVVQRADGRPLAVDVTASALRDHTEQTVGAVGIMRDLADDPGQVRIFGKRVFVSRTSAMRRVYDALPKLAASQAPLLVVGEVGTGRTALAETIHDIGARGRPLVKVRCADQREDQSLERQLEQAERGTLLLQDLCAAPVSLQQQLLAWIEEETDRPRFRVVSTATDRLGACLKQGAFRRDLYYRLNVLYVALPSLEERVEDIPLLVEQFVEEMNLKRGSEVAGIRAVAMRRLMEAAFPGNIRQLKMVVDHAHRQCGSGYIEERHLPQLSPPLRDRREQLERDAIVGALRRADGNITRAARALGMHRTTLWRKIRRLGI